MPAGHAVNTSPDGRCLAYSLVAAGRVQEWMAVPRSSDGYPLDVRRYTQERELAMAFLKRVADRMRADRPEAAATLEEGERLPELEDLPYYAAEAVCVNGPRSNKQHGSLRHGT